MKRDMKIGVIGGDMRQLIMANELAKDGFEVACYGVPKSDGNYDAATRCLRVEDCIADAGAIVLGIPYSTDGKWINCASGEGTLSLKALFEALSPEQIVLAGRLNASAYTLAGRCGIKIIDYFECEELNILNAIPTAEGAIEIAMKELDVTIHGSNALVLGFGRIGQVLAKTLSAMGANVTVAARKQSDFAWMSVYGYNSLNIYEALEASKNSDVIFNTVPDMVLGREILSEIPKNTLIIDLASKPGGVDMKAAKEFENRVIWALSLPGKVAPISAGKIIKETIINVLRREGAL